MKIYKDYRCNNEELPVIGGFVLFNLKRDRVDFTTFSPKFNDDYVTNFDAKIKACTELITSKEETTKLKVITNRMYSTMDSLNVAANSLTIYIKMAKADIPISMADFCIPALRKAIRRRDAEAVLQNIHIMNNCIAQYKEPLTKQGLSETLINLFTSSGVSIHDDNQKQYEIVTNRKELVQNNMGLFNGLYAQIIELCEIGKTIYKGKDVKKVKDYTFSELMKQVRTVPKRTNDTEKPTNTDETEG
jgi:hypothetical protein